MTRLLVSVRDVPEAEAALAGAADLIDVKDPAAGPLGRAPDATRAAIIAAVAGRRPVSAALGEWADERGPLPDLTGLHWVKWGLAGAARQAWETGLLALRDDLARRFATCGLVVAAYADAGRRSWQSWDSFSFSSLLSGQDIWVLPIPTFNGDGKHEFGFSWGQSQNRSRRD